MRAVDFVQGHDTKTGVYVRYMTKGRSTLDGMEESIGNEIVPSS